MRIAYISLHWPRPLSSGVGKKIAQQISMWQKAGHEVRFFLHTHAFPENEAQVAGEQFLYEKDGGLIRREISRSKALQQLLKAVAGYRPDIIFLREGMYVFPMERLINSAPVVVEINTNDVQQHQRLGGVLYRYNLLTRSIALSRAAGFVCASQELAEMEVFTRFHKPTLVVGNGYNLEDVQPFPAPNNAVPHLLFVGSPDNEWHAVDKLVPFARSFPDLEIEVVGYDSISGSEPLPENLHLHGYLRGKEYQAVLRTGDVAFGSLGLHRIGLQEASPLKTRECLAYGLPLIISHLDTDLQDVQSDCLLQIPNREDNLVTHGQAVHDFAWKMRGRRVDLQAIAPRIDWREKEKARLEFFTRVMQ
jgi:hypothetical protein